MKFQLNCIIQYIVLMLLIHKDKNSDKLNAFNMTLIVIIISPFK